MYIGAVVDKTENGIYEWEMPQRIAIDGAGRVVIPKAIRDSLGLHSGIELEIGADAERIILEPVAQEAPMTERGGILIVGGELAGEAIDAKAVQDERLDRLAGVDT